MIHTETRSLLTDALTPPPGYSFISGVATTYSLDLVTLLGLPLHLAWLGHAQQNSEELDPLSVMEGLRRTAAQLTVFCQRGRMQIPRIASPLLGLLEGMVHEVKAPHGGSFHPKVWLLKFALPDGEPHLRLLVLSRNLTDDCSWDVSLQLEGAVGRKILESNRPLRILLESTIESARNLSRNRMADVQRLIADMLRCEWELPAGFHEMYFHALGVGRRPAKWWPLPEEGKWDQLGIISPFVGKEALDGLAESTKAAPFLVSRAEELDRLAAAAVESYESVWTLGEHAESTDKEEAVQGRERGLHAKVFVGKRGRNTHLFVGSANASTAALVAGANVEFMVQLVGRASKVGLPGLWLTEDGLRPLLAEYERTETVDDTEERMQRKRLEDLQALLCAADLSLQCSPESGTWRLDLVGLDQVCLGNVQGKAWPVTTRSDSAVDLADGVSSLRLGVFSSQDLTAFVAFTLTLGRHELSFALSLPLHGAPKDREIEMLRAVLRNREGFVRYLLLVLGDWAGGDGGPMGNGNGSGSGFRHEDLPMFEMLAKAYARDPDRLVRVSEVVKRLQREDNESCDEIMPQEFTEVWRCFEDAMGAQGYK